MGRRIFALNVYNEATREVDMKNEHRQLRFGDIPPREATQQTPREEQRQPETAYYLGVAKTLKGVSCWDCAEEVSRFCTKVGNRRGDKVRIRIEITCQLHGLLLTKEKTVLKSKVVEND